MDEIKRKFESHITCHIKDAAEVERIGTLYNWKFSKIDGDALMGAKPFCYLTAYNPTKAGMYTDMLLRKSSLENAGVEVLRTKIEEIIWDTKTGLNNMEFA